MKMLVTTRQSLIEAKKRIIANRSPKSKVETATLDLIDALFIKPDVTNEVNLLKKLYDDNDYGFSTTDINVLRIKFEAQYLLAICQRDGLGCEKDIISSGVVFENLNQDYSVLDIIFEIDIQGPPSSASKRKIPIYTYSIVERAFIHLNHNEYKGMYLNNLAFAAALGNSLAQYHLADSSNQYLLQAAQGGIAAAQLIMARNIINSNNSDKSKAITAIENTQLREAHIWFQLALNNGDFRANFFLARYFERGFFDVINPKTAVEHYLIFLQHGSAKASENTFGPDEYYSLSSITMQYICNFAKKLLNGNINDSIEVRNEMINLALKLIEALIYKGYPEAKILLAQCQQRGLVVAKDKTKIDHYFDKQAKKVNRGSAGHSAIVSPGTAASATSSCTTASANSSSNASGGNSPLLSAASGSTLSPSIHASAGNQNRRTPEPPSMGNSPTLGAAQVSSSSAAAAASGMIVEDPLEDHEHENDNHNMGQATQQKLAALPMPVDVKSNADVAKVGLAGIRAQKTLGVIMADGDPHLVRAPFKAPREVEIANPLRDITNYAAVYAPFNPPRPAVPLSVLGCAERLLGTTAEQSYMPQGPVRAQFNPPNRFNSTTATVSNNTLVLAKTMLKATTRSSVGAAYKPPTQRTSAAANPHSPPLLAAAANANRRCGK